MQELGEPQIVQMSEPPASEWARLICKLRWIGLDDEARRLENAVSTLAPDKRDSVCSGPFSTD
jgi:hypothetical protein